jgi:uncharacterized membrane protein YdcZ (DUF606 family)
MYWAVIASFMLGIATVVQSGLNRQIAKDWSLNEVTLFNNLLVVGISLLAFIAAKYFTTATPDIFRIKSVIPSLKWWAIIPAICGWFIVMFFPFAISKIGALKVVVIVVASQVICGMLWDYFVEGLSISGTKILAALLAFASVIVANL